MVRLSPISPVTFWAPIAIFASAIALAGCHKPDEITRYTVAKPPPREGKPAASSADQKADAASHDAGEGQDQLLGAIIPRGTTTWFFKMTGPSQAVNAQMKSFAMFLASIKFSDKGPDWALPEGWEEEPGSEFRFATIRIAAVEGPVEMSVIPLPTGEMTFDAYLLLNVNRWREQFGLPPIGEDQLADHVHKMDLGERSIWIVKLEGRKTTSGMGAAPFAGKGSTSREPRAAAPDRAAAPFDCEIPEGWTAAQAGSMQKAVYEVRDSGRQVTISVSSAGGDLAANVNRWRDQVHLPELKGADLENELRKIKVDGQDAIYVEAVGSDTPKPRETILGVIVEAGGQQWFLKLRGDAELAAREKPRFEKFVESIRFRGTR